MMDAVKSFNKTMTDWQISQIRIAGKQAQTTLGNTMSAWEHTVETAAALQQQVLDNVKTPETK